MSPKVSANKDDFPMSLEFSLRMSFLTIFSRNWLIWNSIFSWFVAICKDLKNEPYCQHLNSKAWKQPVMFHSKHCFPYCFRSLCLVSIKNKLSFADPLFSRQLHEFQWLLDIWRQKTTKKMRKPFLCQTIVRYLIWSMY